MTRIFWQTIEKFSLPIRGIWLAAKIQIPRLKNSSLEHKISIGHQNLYDIGADRSRIWKSPSHLDVKYADGWKTWELGSFVKAQTRNRKLVDFF